MECLSENRTTLGQCLPMVCLYACSIWLQDLLNVWSNSCHSHTNLLVSCFVFHRGVARLPRAQKTRHKSPVSFATRFKNPALNDPVLFAPRAKIPAFTCPRAKIPAFNDPILFAPVMVVIIYADVDLGGMHTKMMDGREFLLFDVSTCAGRIICFGTPEALVDFFEANKVFIDGTFFSCPSVFYQMMTLSVVKEGCRFNVLISFC